MIPFAILSGRLYGQNGMCREIRVLELSLEGFTFRLPELLQEAEEDQKADRDADKNAAEYAGTLRLVLHTYDFAAGDYQELELRDFQLEPEEETPFFVQYRLTTGNRAYQQCAKHLTEEYLRYIRLRSGEDDAQVSEALVGYPAAAEARYPESFAQQKQSLFAAWNRGQKGAWEKTGLAACELALSLDRPEVCRRYLECSLPEFAADFWNRNQLADHPIAEKETDCLYIGNQFCPLLFPEETLLFSMLEKAEQERVKAVLVFSYVQENQLEIIRGLLEKLAVWCRKREQNLELVVNDWGMLSMLREEPFFCFSVTLGVLLQKRRKDVRMEYKKGFSEFGDQLAETSVQASFYREYLQKHFRVQRISYESCGYPIKIAPGKASLHFPFYQMNTSQFCTLYAKCRNGDRGKQCAVTHCPEYCRDWVFLYPEALHMIGRYNSLFGYDEEILTDARQMQAFLEQGVDRIVAEFL